MGDKKKDKKAWSSSRGHAALEALLREGCLGSYTQLHAVIR